MNRIITTIASFTTSAALAFSLAGCSAAAQKTTTAHTSLSAPTTTVMRAANTDARSATILIYMNGSDLESYSGEASTDISEMLKSRVGSNVNVVIETLGTSEWQDHGIASDHTQRYLVRDGKLELVDDSLGQLDTTSSETLSDFISWGTKNYPADRYMLLFWDHGAGPVYGFGVDEFQSEESALTLDEIQAALKNNANVHFDLIGMDCCLMSSLETCYVLAPYCDYTVLSEDFEPGVGWSYETWLNALEDNPGIDTAELGKAVVDSMIDAVDDDPENGDATLALIDESAIPALYSTWVDFVKANKETLLGTNYSQQTSQRGRANFSLAAPSADGGHGHGSHGYSDEGNQQNGYSCDQVDSTCHDCTSCAPCDAYGYGYGFEDRDFGPESWDEIYEMWDSDMSYVTMSDYYVTDIMTVASTVDSNESAALENALKGAIVHYSATSGEEGMTGIGVTLPYGDAEFYDQLVEVFEACGIDQDYVDLLEEFVGSDGASTYYDYDTLGYGYDMDEYGYGDLGYETNATGSEGGSGAAGGYDTNHGHGFSNYEYDLGWNSLPLSA